MDPSVDWTPEARGAGSDARERLLLAHAPLVKYLAHRIGSRLAGPVDFAAVSWLHEADPLDPLATLVDKSLLQSEPGPAGATYRMLDPIRAYAARCLVDAGEEARARDRHVEWCLCLGR